MSIVRKNLQRMWRVHLIHPNHLPAIKWDDWNGGELLCQVQY